MEWWTLLNPEEYGMVDIAESRRIWNGGHCGTICNVMVDLGLNVQMKKVGDISDLKHVGR